MAGDKNKRDVAAGWMGERDAVYVRDMKSTKNKGKGVPESLAAPFNVHSLCHFHRGIAIKK